MGIKNIVLDCDPGIDDALAILLFLSEKSFRIRAIISERGNVGLSQTTKNLVDILKLSGVRKFPKIGKGSASPLEGKGFQARPVHGQDGLGNSNLVLSQQKDIDVQDGIDLIVSTVSSGQAGIIIATGPLTNLAKALKREPKIADCLKRIYVMGGALRVPGNVTRFAEFNFFCDPKAAGIVLTSGIPITLVSLDVTQKVILKKDHLAGFKIIDSRLSKFIQHIASFSIDYHVRYRKTRGAFIHDALTAGIAIDERLADYEDLCLDVELDGRKKGRLRIRKGRPNVRFTSRVDSERFLELFLDRLTRLCKPVKD